MSGVGRDMSVFVTGAESFVGRALVDVCDLAGIPVEGVDLADCTSSRWGHLDIRDPALADAIPEGAVVVHLAAISRDTDCRTDPREAFDVNVNGTINVAEASRKRSCPQIVFASSEWVYGEVDDYGTQTEDQVIDGTRLKSEYAISKLVGERLLVLGGYVDVITILRFGIIYGPRSDNFSAVEALLDRGRTDGRVEVGSGRTARRFIHVTDIANGILSCIGRSGNEVFNLSGSELVSLADVVETAARLIGKDIDLVERDRSHPSIRNPDNSLALKLLDWTPRIELEAGLRTVLDHLEGDR